MCDCIQAVSSWNTSVKVESNCVLLFQSACAWSAHQDHRPPRSHRRCVQEEVNSLHLFVAIKQFTTSPLVSISVLYIQVHLFKSMFLRGGIFQLAVNIRDSDVTTNRSQYSNGWRHQWYRAVWWATCRLFQWIIQTLFFSLLSCVADSETSNRSNLQTESGKVGNQMEAGSRKVTRLNLQVCL